MFSEVGELLAGICRPVPGQFLAIEWQEWWIVGTGAQGIKGASEKDIQKTGKQKGPCYEKGLAGSSSFHSRCGNCHRAVRLARSGSRLLLAAKHQLAAAAVPAIRNRRVRPRRWLSC